jgi:hypothetical protein
MLEIYVKLFVRNGCLGMAVITSAIVIKQIQLAVALSMVIAAVKVVGLEPYVLMLVQLGHMVLTVN